ncbi:ZZ-type zinc finger-containing protein 3-like isoform X2 [Rhopilema esculentum]|uniref:ZZ-type zinc finger-containing protein 3-like isoform X2 n=1 Tax=Rhopilema esculentum TaxID=499914 RepID=UPI0031D82E0D
MNNSQITNDGESDVEICVVDEDETKHDEEMEEDSRRGTETEPEENEKSDFIESSASIVTEVPKDINDFKKPTLIQNSKHTENEPKENNIDNIDTDLSNFQTTMMSIENAANDSSESSDDEDSSCHYDSDDDDDGDVFDRFYFESDHLAFKHNKDYKNMLKTLIVLEAARMDSVKDLEKLHLWKEKALKDPISFIEALQSKNPPQLPERRQIIGLPNVDWMQYLTSADSLKYESGNQISTRRSFRTKGDSALEEDRMKPYGNIQEDNESAVSDGSQDQQKIIRGRILDESKAMTFNRLWTTEEQEKLEKLLHIYPPEDVEARRWEKIARALGNRTPKQVSSRVQKYFIKLARAGLPIPGRIPHLTTQRKSKMNPVSYRNSTFFPSWKPSVYMNDDDDDDASSVTTMQSDDTPYPSDEEAISFDLKDSAEYKELMNLKRLRKEYKEGLFHCCSCGIKPIKGPRWYCIDCPDDVPYNICRECNERNAHIFTNTHSTTHRVVLAEKSQSFIDGDYTNFELQEGKYNYLDPNFNPR